MLPFALALYMGRVRFLYVTNPHRIGHLAVEPDAYLKEKRLGMLPRHVGILVVPRDQAANETLLDLWLPHLNAITSPVWARLTYYLFAGVPALWIDTKRYVSGELTEPARYFEIVNSWAERPAVLTMPDALMRRGDEALRVLGVPPGAWFACLHVREAGYSPVDDHIHEYRNCSIENYRLAMDEIARRGGWCLRMGDASTSLAPSHSRLIDYAHSRFRSDWMDIYLSWRCRIFIGTTSGLLMVPMVFGRAFGMTNFVPISRPPLSPKGLGIPKLLREEGSGRYLTFKETVEREAEMSYTTRDANPGIEMLENSPQEILDLVRELLDESDGMPASQVDSDPLQKRFRSIYPHRYYSAPARSRISPAFLRRYEHLLPD